MTYSGDTFAEVIVARIAADRASVATESALLLGFEGEAAAIYFRCLPNLFTEAVAALQAFSFKRRNRKPPPSNQRYLSPYCLTRSRSFRSAGHRQPWRLRV